jgi:Zn finger protein HypA/HybF involved in hydrogenase expression
LPQEVQVQQEEVLLQGQEALLVLAKVREQAQVLEVLLRAQAGVLAQVEAEVLELALAVGLQQVVLERGQVVLERARARVQAKA